MRGLAYGLCSPLGRHVCVTATPHMLGPHVGGDVGGSTPPSSCFHRGLRCNSFAVQDISKPWEFEGWQPSTEFDKPVVSNGAKIPRRAGGIGHAPLPSRQAQAAPQQSCRPPLTLTQLTLNMLRGRIATAARPGQPCLGCSPPKRSS